MSTRGTEHMVSREQFDSICTPFDQCIDKVLSHVSLDEHFVAFYTWCISVSVPIIILSGGLAPLIRALLARSIGHELRGVEVVANGVVPREGFHSIYDGEGAWRVQFRDDSVYGHDKARTIRPYAQHAKELPADERPILLYAGDGVSDISAAEETDLLFAKQGQDLVRYCKQRKIPFTEFRDWKDILEVTQGLYNGTIDVADVVNAALQDGDASKG